MNETVREIAALLRRGRADLAGEVLAIKFLEIRTEAEAELFVKILLEVNSGLLFSGEQDIRSFFRTFVFLSRFYRA